MKIISWSHAWVVILSGCMFISLRDTSLFHPVVAFLIYGAILANQRILRLEHEAAALARKDGE